VRQIELRRSGFTVIVQWSLSSVISGFKHDSVGLQNLCLAMRPVTQRLINNSHDVAIRRGISSVLVAYNTHNPRLAVSKRVRERLSPSIVPHWIVCANCIP
jgi:hypothetical protein